CALPISFRLGDGNRAATADLYARPVVTLDRSCGAALDCERSAPDRGYVHRQHHSNATYSAAGDSAVDHGRSRPGSSRHYLRLQPDDRPFDATDGVGALLAVPHRWHIDVGGVARGAAVLHPAFGRTDHHHVLAGSFALASEDDALIMPAGFKD